MRKRTGSGRLLLVAGAAVAPAFPALTPVTGDAAPAAPLSVDLASLRGPPMEAGEGFLHGLAADGNPAGEPVPATAADRRRVRVALRPVRIHRRDAGQPGLLPHSEPDRRAAPERRAVAAERQLAGQGASRLRVSRRPK